MTVSKQDYINAVCTLADALNASLYDRKEFYQGDIVSVVPVAAQYLPELEGQLGIVVDRDSKDDNHCWLKVEFMHREDLVLRLCRIESSMLEMFRKGPLHQIVDKRR